MPDSMIKIRGAREHNLKNINLDIPRDKLIVMTGLSGSGKSSLAFDTIFADGQRRYIESLSSYARMFLGQMDKPDVDSIDGLSPAVSIDQKTTSKNPRSTVGTVTEIYDYLRLLYARIGNPHCPVCGREIKQQTVDQIVDAVLKLPSGTKFMVLAPVVRGRKGEHTKEFESAQRSGYARARVDGSIYDLTEKIALDKNKKHDIEIVVDRLVINEDVLSRLTDSVETATALSGGIVIISVVDGEDMLFSQSYACPEHGVSVEELTPRMFSFNNPFGACPKCTGLGTFLKIDPDMIIPNRSLSIRGGAVKAGGWGYFDGSISAMYYEALAEKYGFSLDEPVRNIPQKAIDAILFGTGSELLNLKRENEFGSANYRGAFEGVVNNLERRFHETNSEWVREDIQNSMSAIDCPECHGQRLKATSLAVTVGGRNIMDVCELSVTDALEFFEGLKLTEREALISERIIKEIKNRLGFLNNVGLNYLTLARSAATLSGGENQRIRLATQIGSSLMGVLYILDEPSIGLHQRDNEKLIATLRRLRDLGNTLIVVEHDEDTMKAADYIVDIGPGAGVAGGNVVFAGTYDEILKCDASITGQYLSGKKKIKVPKTRRTGNGKTLSIRDARQNNLKNIDVDFPLGTLTCVTGVSGSGKSSLINEILFKKLSADLNGSKLKAGKFDEITGMENVDKVIGIDQSPIGRTPRSNPATYTGLFTLIRDVFAQSNDAKIRGYGPARFSFNVKGGRCEACQGDGIIKIEMHFLPDVYVPCDVCKGKRYNRETLEVKFKGKSISDVLEMTVDEALVFFENMPKLKRKIKTLSDVGLGYVKLGQSSTTLSGGEAQRVKLACELSRASTGSTDTQVCRRLCIPGSTVYVLDEPTTGLHTDDVHKLIKVLQQLVQAGNTVVVIEHNLDIIKTADYIIDLGPEGGDKGGEIVALGTPEQVAECAESYTGQFLKDVLNR